MYRIHTSYSKHTAVVSTSMPCDSVSTLRPDDLLGSIVHLTAIMGSTALPNVIMGRTVLPKYCSSHDPKKRLLPHRRSMARLG